MKLVKKFSKHARLHNIQELDFGTLVLALYCFCGDRK